MQNNPKSETILSEVNEINIGAGENKYMEEGTGTVTSVDKENDSSLGSTDSSSNTSNQIGKIQPQGKFRGKELLLKKKMIKNKNKEKIKKDFFLLQRTGLVNLHLESMASFSTMLFLQCFHATTFQKTLIH